MPDSGATGWGAAAPGRGAGATAPPLLLTDTPNPRRLFLNAFVLRLLARNDELDEVDAGADTVDVLVTVDPVLEPSALLA